MSAGSSHLRNGATPDIIELFDNPDQRTARRAKGATNRVCDSVLTEREAYGSSDSCRWRPVQSFSSDAATDPQVPEETHPVPSLTRSQLCRQRKKRRLFMAGARTANSDERRRAVPPPPPGLGPQVPQPPPLRELREDLVRGAVPSTGNVEIFDIATESSASDISEFFDSLDLSLDYFFRDLDLSQSGLSQVAADGLEAYKPAVLAARKFGRTAIALSDCKKIKWPPCRRSEMRQRSQPEAEAQVAQRWKATAAELRDLRACVKLILDELACCEEGLFRLAGARASPVKAFFNLYLEISVSLGQLHSEHCVASEASEVSEADGDEMQPQRVHSIIAQLDNIAGNALKIRFLMGFPANINSDEMHFRGVRFSEALAALINFTEEMLDLVPDSTKRVRARGPRSVGRRGRQKDKPPQLA